jgi:hypothetical protein
VPRVVVAVVGVVGDAVCADIVAICIVVVDVDVVVIVVVGVVVSFH